MDRTFLDMPDSQGYFGEYGGQLIPPELKAVMDDINTAYDQVRQTAAFQDELAELYAHYVGRPSPIFHAKRLSQRQSGEGWLAHSTRCPRSAGINTRLDCAWLPHSMNTTGRLP